MSVHHTSKFAFALIGRASRIMRLHFVFAALMVFNHYKFKYGLLDNHDLRLKVVERQTQLCVLTTIGLLPSLRAHCK